MRLDERGASLLEMLFAIAITALAMPFAYRQISSIGEDLKHLAVSKRVVADAEPIRNFMRLYPDEFPEGEIVQVETDIDDAEVFVSNVKGDVTAFLVVQEFRGDILNAHKIAGIVGVDAAVVESDGMAYSPHGNWAIMVPNGEHGDIVLRIKSPRATDDTQKYLHRTVLSEGELTAMKRDLSMGGFSIANINGVKAQKLTLTDLDAFLIRAGRIAANALYFAAGLNLNPEKSKIPNIRASGDAIGFRNFYADAFKSPGGTITTDRATIAQKLVVSKKFEVKAPYARTVSGFAGLSAGSVRTAYLDAENLTFAHGFGLTVSGELLYAATPPVRLGSWSFPNSAGSGPRVGALVIKNFSDEQIIIKIPDFSDILKEGWR